MTTLIDLTLRGTLAVALVFALSLMLRRSSRSGALRLWWLVAALVFLCPLRTPHLGLWGGDTPTEMASTSALRYAPAESVASQASRVVQKAVPVLQIVWLAGFLVSCGLVVGRSAVFLSAWRRHRLCTDSRLLDLLEECKASLGITIPIGLIVDEKIPAPAVLGWLRPRLLLPAVFTREASEDSLRHVLRHELAHIRAADIAAGWLFALVRCLHWFNPAAYFLHREWIRSREEAADEAAVQADDRAGASRAYGETLLGMAAETSFAPNLAGIGESFRHLRRRIDRIMKTQHRKPRMLLTALVAVILGGIATLQPGHAESPKDQAVAAMESWLGGIDAGKYPESWQAASADFQKAVTETQWVEALKAVRAPLGELKERKLASALQQTEVPGPKGTIKGNFVIAQFESSFENLKFALETVTFVEEGGTWKASGYYIKPR
ncbi:signal transducer regulating beta-lactamase production [Terrimicrobium sacchariphilum]|uniref:Signal transducer regulating beta-lactamase production n=1 Tax=Terrimicrobium sacchariphilum TaxID=690879 RepID=A0A146G245_TERSA|nr:M56 family metallopeptidase [Terrimicrobium sacchariphilum]GAT31710.1 signal transducer regulating beta-lactamase production [Terrimicrobium sacchariphilum]